MLRFFLPFVAAAALAACSQSPEQNVPTKAEDRSAEGAPPQAGPAPEAEPTPAPAAAGTFDWTGRFAATRKLCPNGAWLLGRERISTAGETSCAVDQIREQPGEATLLLSCTAEGTNSKETWLLTRREGGMRVRRDTGHEEVEVDLLRCQ